MSSIQFIYAGSDTRKITRLDLDSVIVSGDSNSTIFNFKFPESHKGYKKTIEWDFWIKDPEGNLMNPSYPLVNDEHIIPGEVTYFNPGKQVGFSLIFEKDDDPLFRERSTIYPIHVSRGVKIRGIYDALSDLQVGGLTFDDVPIQGSDNPVKSGGIYDALSDLQIGGLILDDAPVEGSDNPVKSGGIYDALQAIELIPGERGEKGEKGDIGPEGPQGPAGTTDYKELINLPLINSVTLIDDLSFTDLGIGKIENSLINNLF